VHRRAGANFTAAKRVFIVLYYRALLNGEDTMAPGIASLGPRPPRNK
jgi:hypothetical protein